MTTMPVDRLGKINSLSDEVRQLHPVLRVLFPRLPNILSVEYRQGPREMGADFVLEKTDATLLTTEYIGVIVKTGKIKQDHSEIDRQIEECELERTFGSGKKKVHISEIWVVSNDSISQGAQDKINHKYKNKSIKFIPGERLLELINKFYEEYWTDVSVGIGDYFRRLEASTKSLSLVSPEIGTSSEIKVERQLVEYLGASDYQRRQRKLRRFSMQGVLDQGRYTLIEASMGAGKSTLLADAALSMACADHYNSCGAIPIFRTVKDVVDSYGCNVEKLVNDVLDELDLEGVACVVFLDGLDELKIDAEEQISVLKNLKESISSLESVSMVVSSRPLAVEHDQVLNKEFNRYSLPPFTIKQVIALVDSICKSQGVHSRLTKDLEKSKLFKVLPKTPISAILLAKLLKENVHEIPSTMTELYGKYMELVMGRWDMSKGLQSQTEYEVLQSVTIQLARYILDNSLDALSVAEARQMFTDYIGSRNLKICPDETFNKLISRAEVFNLSPDGGVMSFRHRTFAEFFYASGMDRQPLKGLDLDVFRQYWSTVYFFYFGLKKDSSELVSQLMALSSLDEDIRIGRMLAVPNLLLAAYLTPYGDITRAVSKYLDEIVGMYMSIISGGSPNSVFVNFSKLELCCIFTKVVSTSLGYDFFLRALRECAEDTYSSPSLDKEYGMSRLFFINSALASIGYQHAYAELLDNYSSELPVQLRIGIVEHSREVGFQTDLVVRYSKHLEKRIRSERGMNNLVKETIKPISELLRLK
ncbi:NACHT domain-containing protein [Stenotrophomonas sp. Y-13]|uniref:NACHT domain-containing protein n=1 Tax=Stenotrophomonas sp. Y-13 TaxID=3384161 RepID=UPI003917054D